MANAFLVGLVVSSYWIISTTLVFVNKQLVSGTGIGLDLSIFIVWFQCIFGVLFLSTASWLGRKLQIPWHDLSNLELDLRKLANWGSLVSSAAYITSLIFNSLLLKYISVSFYQIARSLTIIFVILLSSILLHEKVLFGILIACAFIISGFYIGVHEEVLVNGVQTRGIVYGAVTSLFAALSSTLCKVLQRQGKTSSLQFTYNVFVIGSLTLSSLVLFTSQLQYVLTSPVSTDVTFWCLMLMSGFSCLLVGWISTLQITMTSPLTYIVSTNSKSVFQTLLAVVWNSETKSWLWWLGNGLVIVGIITYTAIKLRLEQKKINMDIVVEEPKIDPNIRDFVGESRSLGKRSVTKLSA